MALLKRCNHMVNFMEAYKSGLNSADLAKKNKKEIDSVFVELQEQILQATERKITVTRKKLPDQDSEQDMETFDFAMVGRQFKSFQELNKGTKSHEKQILHWAIAAENVQANNVSGGSRWPEVTNEEIRVRKLKRGILKELARWTPHPAGYPCQITIGSKIIYCEDKRGLERALLEMLRDPVVGATLQELQNLPIPEQVGTEVSADSINPDATDHAESDG